MSEYMDVLVAYVVGTFAGIWLFHTAVKEFVVKTTLDQLIDQRYLRHFIDDEGITQLVRYDEMTPSEVDDHLARVQEMLDEIERENEKDDSP